VDRFIWYPTCGISRLLREAVSKIDLGNIGAVLSPGKSGFAGAGADHVAISVTADGSRPGSLGPWRELADRLTGR
jgi:hypothetical protein